MSYDNDFCDWKPWKKIENPYEPPWIWKYFTMFIDTLIDN